MQAKEPLSPVEDRTGPRAGRAQRPLLMVDIDGVISLFGPFATPGGPAAARSAAGAFHSIDGIPHFLSSNAAAHLLALAGQYDLVWASGWEERAEEHLPRLLGLPAKLPFLRFDRDVGARAVHARAHWKIDAIEAHAQGRALAWIDDAFDASCREWAAARAAPTLLVQTAPEHGLTAREAELLSSWAQQLRAG